MNSKSKMRIICDPFKKEIEYQWFDSNIEEYVELDPENSILASEEYIFASIQNRAYEIVELINRECNVGNVGLEVVFVGTEDDYNDFCDVINNYFSETSIECVRDNSYYNTASKVMPLIKEKYSEIKGMLDEYSEHEIKELVNKYGDVVKPSISLCVMGLYSSGKSAFINSIIGAEILPSESVPTTKKICKIYCDKKYQISFLFDGKECVLTFEGSAYKPNSNSEKDIIKELQSIIDDGEHDEIFHMNRALRILNSYSNPEHSMSDIIEVRIPFLYTALPTEDFDFVIYDTPGSNSSNNAKDFETLRDSLDEQTNALPIFLTAPDSMDAKDNDMLLTLIDNASALDTANAIIIVNKADEKGPKTLRKICDTCRDLVITKWKSTRVFFMSSIIAIASKKQNPDSDTEWLDEDNFEIYEKNKHLFSGDERKLFFFNIIDKSKADELSDYIDKKRSTHLYKNSGLEAVEKEIIEYARKYALYNKCQQASSYLQRAIELCVDNVKDVEDKLKVVLDSVKERFDFKKRDLCDKLESRKKDIAFYNADFQKLIESEYTCFAKETHFGTAPEDYIFLQSKLQDKWKSLKALETQDKSKSFSLIQKYTEDYYNENLDRFSQKVNSHIDSFWANKSSDFKNKCKDIVHDSDALTEEQKNILQSIVLSMINMSTYRMGFDLRKIGAIRKRRFLFWQLKTEKFDAKRCANLLIESFNDAVRKRIAEVLSNNEKNFGMWTDQLVNILIEELCKFNSELNSDELKIESIKRDIDSKRRCEAMLTSSKEYIDKLLSMQEDIGNG